MKQVVVTLEQGADASLITLILENIKGVVRTSMRDYSEDHVQEDSETTEWIKKMKNLSNSVNPSVIDMEDERTKYLMSK
ncbi:MAG: hypothetical protein HDS98_05460 [Bacteroidales bacterium]|nr:hypothetical protein [Bacteroidales bacterium]